MIFEKGIFLQEALLLKGKQFSKKLKSKKISLIKISLCQLKT
jgi:hypothetical protein